MDIVNVCSLCSGKCIIQVKDDGFFFIKLLKSIYSSCTIHIYETADIFGEDFPPDFIGRVFLTSCSSIFYRVSYIICLLVLLVPVVVCQPFVDI